jgi:nitroimidazol reductase NimA-like FMN-containing flavoprotein (pyridoxamine 5'-phosphate oxidase superfamily)
MKWTRAEREFLETARVARLATVAPDGGPHAVPICPLFEKGVFYLGTDRETAKVRHIRANRRVALVVDDYTEDWRHLRGVLVEGEARVLDGRAFRSVRARLYRKFLQYEAIAPLTDRDAIALEITPRRKVSWGF